MANKKKSAQECSYPHPYTYTTAIKICGVDCLDTLEYLSSKKLICYTPKVVGPGDIIVNTLNGGPGRCTVTFTGLEPEPIQTLGKYSIKVGMAFLLKPTMISRCSPRVGCVDGREF